MQKKYLTSKINNSKIPNVRKVLGVYIGLNLVQTLVIKENILL